MALYAGGVVNACDIYEVFDVDLDKPWQLLSHYFPDKIGGRPAWLSLNPLPTPDDVKCGRCKRPCALLLQKYAPKETLHRTIFVFMCREPECCRPDTNHNFVVLRSQLSFVNDFYSVDPPAEDFFDMSSDYPRACKWTPLCAVCGCSGPKQCGKCRRVNYCSREHQTVDWTSGHKSECSGSSSGWHTISVHVLINTVLKMRR
jgi:pre-rRNA-processing protein TSR4